MRNKSALTLPFVILCLMPLMIQCKIEESPNSLDTYSAKRSKQDSAINQNSNNNERDYGDILELNDDFQPIGEQDGDGAIKQFVSNEGTFICHVIISFCFCIFKLYLFNSHTNSIHLYCTVFCYHSISCFNCNILLICQFKSII